jgi:hypothetical protein
VTHRANGTGMYDPALDQRQVDNGSRARGAMEQQIPEYEIQVVFSNRGNPHESLTMP